MEKSHSPLIFSALMMVGLLLISVLVFDDKPYLTISFAIIALTILPMFASFELKQIQSKEIVFLAVLAAIAAIGRVPFAPLPSVQPTTFIIIVSALVLGPQAGFMIGAAAAIVSNIFLGQGPWTPWQMFAWGMIGLVAGLLRNTGFMKNKSGLLAYGFSLAFFSVGL